MSWSIPILRIAGIQLRIHITFLLLIGWLALGSAGAVVFVLLLFLCVVLHEFGHALAAKGYGINTPDITLLPIGGVARLERIPEEPKQELIIAAAGPAVTAIIAFSLFVVIASRGSAQLPAFGQEGDLVLSLFKINVWLLLFNLIPAFPMDGGRVLRALLATSQHDFPVLDESGNVAGILTRHDLIAALRKNDLNIRVGDVMRRDIPTVTTGTRFEEAFRIMQECNCPAVPVLDSMKRLVGLLTPENVSELMMVQSALPRRRAA